VIGTSHKAVANVSPDELQKMIDEAIEAWERKMFALVACDALIAGTPRRRRPFFRATSGNVAELLAAGLRDFSFVLLGLCPVRLSRTPGALFKNCIVRIKIVRCTNGSMSLY